MVSSDASLSVKLFLNCRFMSFNQRSQASGEDFIRVDYLYSEAIYLPRFISDT